MKTTLLVALVVLGIVAVATAQQTTPPSESAFKVLEGTWRVSSGAPPGTTLTLGVFIGNTPATWTYMFSGRPVELAKVTAEDSKPIKLVVEGKTGLVMRLEYYPMFGGTLKGKAKPAGGAMEFDVTFYRDK